MARFLSHLFQQARPTAWAGTFAALRIGLASCRQQFTRILDHAFFPTNCPVCDRRTVGSPICRPCKDAFLDAPLLCHRCAMPMGPFASTKKGCSECRGHSLGFDRALALGVYQGPLRELCLKLKHHENAWIGHWICRILIQARSESFKAIIERDPDSKPIIVAVPQHWKRKIARAFYNQADELAAEFAGALKLRLRKPLRRVRSTRKLANLSKTQRAAELHNAFRAAEQVVRGRHVLLVDDILTTGATCTAAARALKKAGARTVTVVVIARSEGRG